MSKTQKPKSNKGTRNDNRKNGKADKKNPGRKSKRSPLSELDKVLLGKGIYPKWRQVVEGKKPGISASRAVPMTKPKGHFPD